jgi:hypothetical protein
MVTITSNKGKPVMLPVQSYLATMSVNAGSERRGRMLVLAQLTLACFAAGDNVKVGATSIGGDGVDANYIRDAIKAVYDKDTAKRIIGAVRYLLDKMASPIRACMESVDAEAQVSAVVSMLADKGISSQYDLDVKRGRAKAQKAKRDKAKKAKEQADKAEGEAAEAEADDGETAAPLATLALALSFIETASPEDCNTLAKAIADRLAEHAAAPQSEKAAA